MESEEIKEIEEEVKKEDNKRPLALLIGVLLIGVIIYLILLLFRKPTTVIYKSMDDIIKASKNYQNETMKLIEGVINEGGYIKSSVTGVTAEPFLGGAEVKLAFNNDGRNYEYLVDTGSLVNVKTSYYNGKTYYFTKLGDISSSKYTEESILTELPKFNHNNYSRLAKYLADSIKEVDAKKVKEQKKGLKRTIVLTLNKEETNKALENFKKKVNNDVELSKQLGKFKETIDEMHFDGEEFFYKVEERYGKVHKININDALVIEYVDGDIIIKDCEGKNFEAIFNKNASVLKELKIMEGSINLSLRQISSDNYDVKIKSGNNEIKGNMKVTREKDKVSMNLTSEGKTLLTLIIDKTTKPSITVDDKAVLMTKEEVEELKNTNLLK